MMPDLFGRAQARKSRASIMLEPRLPAHIVVLDNNCRQLQYRRGRRQRAPPRKDSELARTRHSAEQVLPLRGRAAARRSARPKIALGALDDHLGYFVRRLQIWVFRDFIRTLAEIDVRPAQFSVLVVIGANRGISQAELGATLGIERARLARLLHLLQDRSLVRRLQSSADGRRHALQLTAHGRTLLARAKSLAARHERKLLLKLGAERHGM